MSGRDYPKRSLSSDNYRTDTWILSMFEGWFDPCPLDPEWEVDGLRMRWPHRTFVNPPYSNPLPWVKKAILVNEEYEHTIALLLKHDSSTEWYRLLHEARAKFLLVHGRLKHQTGTGAAFPSVIVILEGNHNADLRRQI
jgi:hypothetical protein